MSLKNNVKWVALSQFIKILIQIVSLTVLTRLLAPSEYGLMAMATVVTNFSLIIRDLGTAAAIIQRKNLHQDIISTVFWLNLAMGILIFIIIVSGSPFIAQLFNTNKLIPVLIWISLTFPIASAGSTSLALLERNSHFKKIASIEIISSGIGLLVALMMAYQGMGVYSLVGQTLTTSVISTTQLWFTSSWKPKLIFSKTELKQLFSFSGNLTIFNLINYFSRNMDSIIIGHFFSATILGAYSLAYRVMLFPLQNLTAVVSRSLYPLMSRQQDNILEIKVMFLKVICVIASFTAPMMAGLAILREPFVHLVFGHQWLLVPQLLLWLAPVGFIQSLISATGSVFMAKNRTNLQMKLGIFSSILFIGAFITGAQFDVQHIAIFYFLGNLINIIPPLYFVTKIIGANIKDLIFSILAPISSTIIMVIALLLFDKYFHTNESWFAFILQILVGFSSYFIAYRGLFSKTLKSFTPVAFQKYLILN